MFKSIRSKLQLIFCFGVIIGLVFPAVALATVSDGFFRSSGHIYDDWGIFRTTASGPKGFLSITNAGFDPIIAYESLGGNTSLAWKAGESLSNKYKDRNRLAEEIFYYVRDRITYTSDLDQFGVDEFAQNADELMTTILQKRRAYGDCEDSAVLLAVMFKAAGFRSAMVLMPGHVATLVYMPEYREAPRKLTLGEENGWVWAEATGATNRLGWVPRSLAGESLIASELNDLGLNIDGNTSATVAVISPQQTTQSGTSSSVGTLAFGGSTGLLWILGASRSRSRRSKNPY